MNVHAEFPKGESTWRKEYSAFNRGRIYERTRGEDKIATRIISLSDFHVPYQKPVEVFSDYAGRVDTLQINGDLIDATQLSRFPKKYRTSPIEEIITARQYVIDLIELIRPKNVLINAGNHELRQGDFIAKAIDNEIQELVPETALDSIFTDGFTHYDRRTKSKTKYEPLCNVFDDIEITYTGTWWSKIGNIIFCHPKAFNSGIMKTAEKALFWFRNEGYNPNALVMAHTHRLGQYDIGNSIIYEQGTCSETKKIVYADGMLVNSQVEGFIYLCLDKDGNIIRDKTKLVRI